MTSLSSKFKDIDETQKKELAKNCFLVFSGKKFEQIKFNGAILEGSEIKRFAYIYMNEYMDETECNITKSKIEQKKCLNYELYKEAFLLCIKLDEYNVDYQSLDIKNGTTYYEQYATESEQRLFEKNITNILSTKRQKILNRKKLVYEIYTKYGSDSREYNNLKNIFKVDSKCIYRYLREYLKENNIIIDKKSYKFRDITITHSRRLRLAQKCYMEFIKGNHKVYFKGYVLTNEEFNQYVELYMNVNNLSETYPIINLETKNFKSNYIYNIFVKYGSDSIEYNNLCSKYNMSINDINNYLIYYINNFASDEEKAFYINKNYSSRKYLKNIFELWLDCKIYKKNFLLSSWNINDEMLELCLSRFQHKYLEWSDEKIDSLMSQGDYNKIKKKYLYTKYMFFCKNLLCVSDKYEIIKYFRDEKIDINYLIKIIPYFIKENNLCNDKDQTIELLKEKITIYINYMKKKKIQKNKI